MIQVYKIVRQRGYDLVSASMSSGPFRLIYRKGRRTFPPIGFPDAGLFAFRTREQAESSIWDVVGDNPAQIWICTTSDAHAIETISTAIEVEVELFWQGKGIYTKKPPTGTVICPYLCLRKKLGDWNGTHMIWDWEALDYEHTDIRRTKRVYG